MTEQTDDLVKPLTIEQTVAYLRDNCMYLKHGRCTTRRCIVLGGWDKKTVPINVEPTCEYRMAADRIEAYKQAIEDVERIAKAMWEAEGCKNHGYKVHWDEADWHTEKHGLYLFEADRERWRKRARAAIKFIEERVKEKSDG